MNGARAAVTGGSICRCRRHHIVFQLGVRKILKIQPRPEGTNSLSVAWRELLARSPSSPRSDAAAWAVIDVLPAHPMITAPVATAATGRAKSQVYQALDQLKAAGVLKPLSAARRNQAWKAVSLLDLIAGLEAGDPPVAKRREIGATGL
jgi:hypothetical protein